MIHFPALYAITDSQLLAGNRLIEAVEAAFIGGCRLVQYRDKSNDQIKRLKEAQALRSLCNRYQAQLIINDDIKLALAVKADGAHMGQGDGDVAAARALLGEQAILGVTCHDSLSLAETAIQQGASYIAFGRFFPSSTKPEAPPAPLSLLAQARTAFPCIPIIAIGGISSENAALVFAEGANSVAVSHALFAANDIGLAAKSFLNAR